MINKFQVNVLFMSHHTMDGKAEVSIHSGGSCVYFDVSMEDGMKIVNFVAKELQNDKQNN